MRDGIGCLFRQQGQSAKHTNEIEIIECAKEPGLGADLVHLVVGIFGQRAVLQSQQEAVDIGDRLVM